MIALNFRADRSVAQAFWRMGNSNWRCTWKSSPKSI